MLIKMRINRLLFVGLKDEEILNVEKWAGDSIILKDVSGGVQVTGKKEHLYNLLFEVSKVYDIEII